VITQQAINTVILGILKAESSAYTNNPNDRGGPTKYGITLNTLRGEPGLEDATAESVKNLTQAQAVEIYARRYAAPYTPLSNKQIFAFCVNGAVQHGVAGMNKIIQRAIGVTPDGILGTASWRELQQQERNDPTALLADIVAERCKYYANIISKDSSQRAFAAGWLNRIAGDLA
jgi:lysozyme family protein